MRDDERSALNRDVLRICRYEHSRQLLIWLVAYEEFLSQVWLTAYPNHSSNDSSQQTSKPRSASLLPFWASVMWILSVNRPYCLLLARRAQPYYHLDMVFIPSKIQWIIVTYPNDDNFRLASKDPAKIKVVERFRVSMLISPTTLSKSLLMSFTRSTSLYWYGTAICGTHCKISVWPIFSSLLTAHSPRSSFLSLSSWTCGRRFLTVYWKRWI